MSLMAGAKCEAPFKIIYFFRLQYLVAQEKSLRQQRLEY
jgi:hypothetical protein